MELPDWVVDEVPSRTRGGVPLLLLVKLFRHGTRVVDPETGGRRAYWNGQLARLTGASKRALDGAVDELVALGVLRVHEPRRHGAARGYSVGYDAPSWGVVPGPGGPGRGVVPVVEWGAENAPSSRNGGAKNATPQIRGDAPQIRGGATQIRGGAKTAHPRESRAHANGGGDPDHLPDQWGDGSHHHPSGETREQILRTLRTLGVDSPGAVLATHGPERVLGALGELAREMGRGPGAVRNPAGWLVAALADRRRVFEESGPAVLGAVVSAQTGPVDAFEEVRARYLGGSLAHVVRWRLEHVEGVGDVRV